MATEYKKFTVSPKWDNTTNSAWHSTGLSVTVGQALSITASGRVSPYSSKPSPLIYPGWPEWFGPDGITTSLFPVCTKVDVNKPVMMLLAKIIDFNDDNNSGDILRVGRNFSGVADATGILCLTVNDCNQQSLFDDNRGSFKTVIVVDPPGVPNHEVPCPGANDAQANPTTVNPIELYDGNKVLSFTDLELNTPAGKLSFERGYDQSKLADEHYRFMGLGWSHNHALKLVISGTVAEIFFPNGGVLKLNDPTSSGHFEPLAGSTSVLDVSGANYVLTAEDKSQYTFEPSGVSGSYRLLNRKWSNGEQWNYSYSSNKLDEVNDGYGRKLKFVYRSSGGFDADQLWRVGDQTAAATLGNTTPSGRYIEFTYTTQKLNGLDHIVSGETFPRALLSVVRDVKGNDWSYVHYGILGSGANPENDIAKMSFLVKRVSPQVDVDGDGVIDTLLNLEQLSYTLSGSTITHISQQRGNGLLDTQLTFEKNPAIGKNQTIEAINMLSVDFIKTHFFANGVYLGTGMDDQENSPFNIQVLDGNYRPLAQVDGAGNKTQMEWADSNVTDLPGALLTKVTDASGEETLFEYNDDDTLRKSTDAEGRKTLYVYDPNRRSPTLVIVANEGVEKAINGDMETSTGWSTLLSATTGLVSSPVDSGTNARQVTAAALNAGIESAGVTLQNTYTYVISARVRPASGQVKMQLVNGGTVLKSTLSDTTPAQMNTWQTLRLVYTTNSLITGSKLQFLANVASTSFYVDSVHMIETASLQRWQEFIYDNKLRPLFERVITPTNAALQQETERVHGTTGNDAGLVQSLIQRDPLAVSNNYTYIYTYDSASRVVTTQKQSIFGSCEFTHTVYDEAGLVLATVCGPTGTTPTTVSAARNMYSTNNQNKVTTYEYDTLGRQVRVTINDGTGSTNAQTTLTIYDALSRVIRTIANYTNPSALYAPPGDWVWDTTTKVWKDANDQIISHGTDPVAGTVNTQNIISINDYNKVGAVSKQTDVLGNVTLYGYDTDGRVVKTIRNASVPDYNNDYAGTSPNVADPGLSAYVINAVPDQDIVTETVYNTNGHPVKSVDPLGNVSYTVFDTLNRPRRTIRNAKASARIDLYDTDPAYHKGDDPYSLLYIPSTLADEDQIERTEYDSMGRAVKQIDTLGKVTYTVYDDQGRVSKTIRNYIPQGTTDPKNWFWYEDAVPTLRWQRSSSDTTLINHGTTNDQNIITYTVYDPEGRVLYTQDPLGRRTWNKYDGLGRVVKTIANAAALPTVTLGSANDPRSSSYVPSSDSDKDRITLTTYNTQGQMQWTQDANGRKNWTVYDSQGRVVKTIANCTYISGSPAPEDPTYVGSSNADDDIITRTEYDLWGRVAKTIDPLGNETWHTYDVLGRRTQTIVNYINGIYDPAFPDVDLIQTSAYDVLGRVMTTTDARGTQTAFTYDQAGRRLTVTQAANSPLALASYTVYDKAGRTLRSIAGYTPLYQQNGQVVYQPANGVPPTLILPFSKTGNVWDFVPPHHGAANDRNLISEWVYDKAGRQISMIDPLGNSVQTTYFKDGMTDSVTDPEGVVSKYRYDALRRRIRVVQAYSAVQVQPKITFVANPSGNAQVHTMNVDGTSRTNLSNNAFFENVPSWSPDGSKLVYRTSRLGGTYHDLYTMKADGTGFQRLTTLSGNIDKAVWSPDGRQIAFGFSSGGGSTYLLSIINADGTNPRTIPITVAGAGVFGISWSPDGQRLVISANSGNLYILQADGSDVVDLERSGTYPFWSPDSSRIAYISSTDIFVVKADGSDLVQLTNTANNPGNGIHPAWSPDSTQIIFSSDRDGDNEIFKVNADNSGGLVKLTTNTLSDSNAAWSPQAVDPLHWIWSTANTRWEYGNANALPHGTDNDQNIIVDVTYDKGGRILTQRDPRGNVTSYSYDRLGRRISLTNSLSKVWTTTYTDLAGGRTRARMNYPGITGSANYNVDREFDRAGHLSTIKYGAPTTTPAVAMSYDKQGKRLKVSEYSNDTLTTRIRETNFNYDTARRLSSVGFDTDGNGTVDETVAYQYDAGGLRTQLTMPGNLNIVYTYDQRGQLLSLTDWDNQKTQFAYDQMGRHRSTERPNGLRSRHEYDAGGRLRVLHHSQESYAGAQFPTVDQINLLDRFDRANGVIGSDWSGTTGGYSINNNELNVGTGGDIYWAGGSFGADQEVFVRFNDIDSASTEMSILLKAQSALWSNGVIKVMYKPSTSKVQVWTYVSSQGWIQRGADLAATFTYGDFFGARALSSGRVLVYKNNILIGECDTSGWTLNANGGSIGLWMVNSSNSTLNDFTGGNFIPSAKVSMTVAHFEYQLDKRGNRIQALEVLSNRAPGYGMTISFIDKGLLLSENWLDIGDYKENSQTDASLKLMFLGEEAILSMGQGPDHSIYDVYLNGTLWQSFDGYAASAGQRDIVVSMGMDSRKLHGEGPHVLEIRNRKEKHKTSTGYKVRFKQLTVLNEKYTQQNITYSYDKIARLKEARYNPGMSTTAIDQDLLRRYLYSYDRAGNRTQESITLSIGTPAVTNYSYNAANQINTAGFSYDNNGNLLTDGTNTYTWNRANRLLTASSVPIGTTTYVYDGLGNLVRKTSAAGYANYLLDLQPNLAAVLQQGYSSGNKRYFVHSPYGILEQGYVDPSYKQPWYWPVSDGLGSIRSVVNFSSPDNDPIIGIQNYSPYGEGYGDSTFPSFYDFTGEMQETYGLLYLRARYYNPAIGTFASLDPFEGVLNRAMSLNGYSWVEGNTPNNIDPTGKQPSQGSTCNCDTYLLNGDIQSYMICLNQHLLPSIVFQYSRGAAAGMANYLASIGSQYVGGLHEHLYSGEIESGKNTNSMRFISLALAAGGFPMTADTGDKLGWNASCNSGRIDGNQVWRTHDNFVQYLKGEQNNFIGGMKTSNSVGSVNLVDLFPNLFDNRSNKSIPENLDALTANMSQIGTGDYIFGRNGSGKGIHGYMVVDKGPVVSCEDMSTVIAEGNTFYVADLYGVQRGTSRPFYCLALCDSQGREGGCGYFQDITFLDFYKVPDTISVPCDQIYNPNFNTSNFQCNEN